MSLIPRWENFHAQHFRGVGTAIIRCIQKRFLGVELYYIINQVLSDTLSIFTFLAPNPVHTLSFKLHVRAEFYELEVVLLKAARKVQYGDTGFLWNRKDRASNQLFPGLFSASHLNSLGTDSPPSMQRG